MDISDIDEMLLSLPAKKIQAVRDYVGFLMEKEKKHKAFEKRVLKAEKEPGILFENVEDAVKAVFDETEN
ncbi:MAG: hypothetical protein HZC45_02775 [Deltaproteobacteria bacterium]|nr:hypothetical protein [Deltaproteobacteria bacterium]